MEFFLYSCRIPQLPLMWLAHNGKPDGAGKTPADASTSAPDALLTESHAPVQDTRPPPLRPNDCGTVPYPWGCSLMPVATEFESPGSSAPADLGEAFLQDPHCPARLAVESTGLQSTGLHRKVQQFGCLSIPLVPIGRPRSECPTKFPGSGKTSVYF